LDEIPFADRHRTVEKAAASAIIPTTTTDVTMTRRQGERVFSASTAAPPSGLEYE
jgi:hypothetical protein